VFRNPARTRWWNAILKVGGAESTYSPEEYTTLTRAMSTVQFRVC